MYEVFEKLLKQAGVRTSEVCAATGIKQSTFSDWKSGRSVPKLEKLRKIADYFGVTVDYLLTDEAPEGHYISPEAAEAAQEILENKELKHLFDAARDASPEDIRAIHDMLLALKRKDRK